MTGTLAAVTVAALLLVGCGQRTRDIAYYVNHPDEMKSKLQWCVAYPEQAIKDDGCAAAGKAQAQVAAKQGDAVIQNFLKDNNQTFAPPPGTPTK